MLRYYTSEKNIAARQAGFSATDLLLTFWDAIKVARGLGVQYLWIDSLYITQMEDNKKNRKWKQESERT